jgi:hypothetical protein
MALWVEKTHGLNGPVFIAEQVGRLALNGEGGGVVLWQNVARRLQQLQAATNVDPT